MKKFKSNTEFRNHYGEKKIFSQNGQDSFVLDYFEYKKNGTFLDIGANNGISLSNTYILEKEYDWTGICIEPIPITFEKLDKNRNCIKLNIGISNKNGKERFGFMEKSSKMLSGIIEDYHPKHLQRINKQLSDTNSNLTEIEIQCYLIGDILENYSINKIDYMNIDTEGSELRILKTIDFEKIHIECMSIENNYNDKEQRQFIISKGYKLIGTLGGDEIFIKE